MSWATKCCNIIYEHSKHIEQMFEGALLVCLGITLISSWLGEMKTIIWMQKEYDD